MSNIWDGKHFWIWNIASTFNGDIDEIIDRIKQMNFRGVIVKSHDADRIWFQFRDTIKAFKNAGLIVGAWGYHYGDNVEGEANAAINALDLGADWYVIDAEIQYEGKSYQASQLGYLLREKYPNAVIGYSSFPFVNVHTAFPYKEFSSFCNVALPQIYWGDLQPTVDVCIAKTFEYYKEFNLPIAPAGQTYISSGGYVPTDADYETFEEECKKRDIAGVNFWSLQSATYDMLNSVAKMDFLVKEDEQEESNVVEELSDAVKKAVSVGIFTQDENGNVRPNEALTREQFAIVLDRLGVLDALMKIKGVE